MKAETLKKVREALTEASTLRSLAGDSATAYERGSLGAYRSLEAQCDRIVAMLSDTLALLDAEPVEPVEPTPCYVAPLPEPFTCPRGWMHSYALIDGVVREAKCPECANVMEATPERAAAAVLNFLSSRGSVSQYRGATWRDLFGLEEHELEQKLASILAGLKGGTR